MWLRIGTIGGFLGNDNELLGFIKDERFLD
jgi:hypothetical protein